MVKRIITAAFAILILLSGLTAAAASPHDGAYDTYTYSYKDSDELPSATAYIPTRVIKGGDLKTGDFKNLGDIHIDEKSGCVILADTGNNRVLICDTELDAARELSGCTGADGFSAFSSPSGVFLDTEGLLYVADTGNSRVVRMTLEGELLDTFPCPQINQFKSVEYKPKKVAVSGQGDIYIVCEGIYEGIVSLDRDGVFQGFSGTNTVTPNPWELFWRSVSTKKQRESMSSFLPVTFLNVDTADGEFVYAVSQHDNSASSLVKKLNPGGSDVLRNNSGQTVTGDHGNLYNGRKTGYSSFSDICGLDGGLYACTDISRARMFVYDRDGELVFAFGGQGNQTGNLMAPSGIDSVGYDLYVTDSGNNSITVYSPTEYGKCLLDGLCAYDEGDLERAGICFSGAFRYSTNSETAYLGLGKIQLKNGDCAAALASFRLANNRTYYSKALKKTRSEFINRNFTVIFISVILFSALFILFGSLKKRSKSRTGAGRFPRLDRWAESTDFAFFCCFHPFKGFDELKREKSGTVGAAVTILLLFTVSSVLSASMSGFLFSTSENVSFPLETAKAVLPLLLFCVVNWGITTLFDGEGSMKYIFISACYALWPLAVMKIPLTLLSNILVSDEAGIYYTVLTILYVVTAFLLIIGNMCVHDFSMKKTLLMLVTTVFGMAVIIFILFLFLNLWYELFSLLSQLAREIKFRM